MKKRKTNLVVLSLTIMVIALVSMGCGNKVKKVDWIEDAANDVEAYSVSDYPFAENQKKLIEIYEEAMEADVEEMIGLSTSTAILSDAVTYKRTLSEAEYLYYGGVKGSKPSGKGVIFEISSDMQAFVVRYIGEFKKGKLDGNVIEISSDESGFFYVSFEGKYKKGLKSGLGYSYYPSEEIEATDDMNLWSENFETTDEYVSDIEVYRMPLYVNAIYKKGKMNGDGIAYYPGGDVFYEGTFKKDDMKKGTIYREDGSILYKGELKNGEYHGKGVLYNEDGDVVHKGKFKNGNVK